MRIDYLKEEDEEKKKSAFVVNKSWSWGERVEDIGQK